jgi:thiol-disulfide isomerase/thioredoxin
MKAFLVAFLACNLLSPGLNAQQPLVLQPEKPKPGEKIFITYNTAGTSLFGVHEFDAVAYLMEGAMPLAKEIKLTRSGTVYKGEVSTNDTTKAVFFKFVKGEKKDNNNELGYFTMMYTADKTPVPGARRSVGIGFGGWSYTVGLKQNAETALKWSKDEIANNPSLKEKTPMEYIAILQGSKDEADKAEMKAFMEKMIAKPGVSEKDLSAIKFIYDRQLKDKEKGGEVYAIIKKTYPNGEWIKGEKVEAFVAEKDPEKKEALYKEIASSFPPKTEAEKNALGNYAYSVASSYANAEKFDKFKEYAALITDKSMLASLYNSVAWKQSGAGVYGKPGNLALGKELSAKSLELVKELQQSGSKKPPFLTEAQYKKDQEQNYYMFADTYALLLFHDKDYQKAYELQKKAVEVFERKDVSMNEAYAVYVEKVNGAAEAQKELESFIKDGKNSPKMKEQLKTIYLAQNKTEADWAKYVDELEKESKAKRRAELAKMMINEPAPPFKLKDIDGSDVSLASLKGKIVIVDFWATWCGPCVASFPGMKKAVEKYKADPNVKFVFIDTWENGEKEKVKKNVGEFIEKNAYPFHVLMDYDSKIVEQFKVDGIPTKFVIDAKNNIRFKSVGFGGNTDGLVDELAIMIEMAKGSTGSGEPAKKAF